MSKIYMLTILALFVSVGYGTYTYYQAPLRIGVKNVADQTIKVEVKKDIQKDVKKEE